MFDDPIGENTETATLYVDLPKPVMDAVRGVADERGHSMKRVVLTCLLANRAVKRRLEENEQDRVT